MDSHQSIIPALEAVGSHPLSEAIDGVAVPGRDMFWLAGLIILALVPRTLMAWKIETVCNDAHYYMHVADALGKGDYAQAFSYLNLNIYPVILLVIHGFGLNWILAGKVWGVLISSLTVLPMYGWIRHMFDKRIAVTACLLYAVHPELIEVSIEPIRGPTFWFLMTLGLYLSFRSVTEVRMWLFVSTGIVTALAIHTRSEGWLLFTPIALWSCYRFRRFPNLRWKLSSGMVVCLAMTPLLLVMVNVTLLKSHNQWEWGRMSPFKTCLQWVQTGIGSEADSTSMKRIASAPPPSNRDIPGTTQTKSPSTEGPVRTYFKGLLRTLEPVTVILLFEGLLICFLSFQQRDKSVLEFVAAGFLLAIWIRLSQIGDINGRYFFPVYFLMVPFVAIGFLWSCHIMTRLGRRLFSSAPLQIMPAVGLSLILTCVYLTDALNADHRHRETERSFGMWLKENYGPLNSVVTNQRALRVGYYAFGKQPIISETLFTPNGFQGLNRMHMMIISTRDAPVNYQHHLQKKLTQQKWRQIPRGELPETAAGFLVLVKLQPPTKTASKPESKSPPGNTQRR
jgi:hypothetical protein